MVKGDGMNSKARDIVERTFQFALAVVRFSRENDHRESGCRVLARQLMRSATSVGANVEEAQAGQSRADFISKYCIALKEAREARYWLRLLMESSTRPTQTGPALRQEAEEIMRILGAIIVKAKRNATPK